MMDKPNAEIKVYLGTSDNENPVKIINRNYFSKGQGDFNIMKALTPAELELIIASLEACTKQLKEVRNEHFEG